MLLECAQQDQDVEVLLANDASCQVVDDIVNTADYDPDFAINVVLQVLAGSLAACQAVQDELVTPEDIFAAGEERFFLIANQSGARLVVSALAFCL